MDEIAGAMTQFFESSPAWVNAALAVVAAASAVAALTPGAEDDRFVAKLRRIVDVLALNIGHARPKPTSRP